MEVICKVTTPKVLKDEDWGSSHLFNEKQYNCSVLQCSQVVQGTDSYNQLLWQQYLTNINFNYTIGGRIAMPRYREKKH